jgi:propionate CoA-transferase
LSRLPGLVRRARSWSAREAVRLIRVGDTVAIGGFFAIGLALEVIHELGAVFGATDEETLGFGKQRDLTLVFCVSPGDWESGGAIRLAQPGLVKPIIGGHWSAVPALYSSSPATRSRATTYRSRNAAGGRAQ